MCAGAHEVYTPVRHHPVFEPDKRSLISQPDRRARDAAERSRIWLVRPPMDFG
jgi:hypothetical protein